MSREPAKQGKLLPLRRVDGVTEEMSDEALIAACAVGERAALGALFDRHADAVYRFVSRAATTSASDADDLVQATFMQVWRSADRFGGKGSARSWILGIAANLIRHHARGEARRRAALDNLAHVPERRSNRPDDEVARRELVGRLGDALAKLPHDLRVAFVMCDLEQVAGVDAARALRVRPGTMWRRLHQARRKLRAALEGGTR